MSNIWRKNASKVSTIYIEAEATYLAKQDLFGKGKVKNRPPPLRIYNAVNILKENLRLDTCKPHEQFTKIFLLKTCSYHLLIYNLRMLHIQWPMNFTRSSHFAYISFCLHYQIFQYSRFCNFHQIAWMCIKVETPLGCGCGELDLHLTIHLIVILSYNIAPLMLYILLVDFCSTAERIACMRTITAKEALSVISPVKVGPTLIQYSKLF